MSHFRATTTTIPHNSLAPKLSTPAQFQCSHSRVLEPGNEATLNISGTEYSHTWQPLVPSNVCLLVFIHSLIYLFVCLFCFFVVFLLFFCCFFLLFIYLLIALWQVPKTCRNFRLQKLQKVQSFYLERRRHQPSCEGRERSDKRNEREDNRNWREEEEGKG